MTLPSIYLFTINNNNTGKRCEICPKLTIKTPERRQWRCSGVLKVNFEYISRFADVSIATLSMYLFV